jgi:hypothetical protein
MSGFLHETSERGHRYIVDDAGFLWGPKYRDREFTQRGVGFLSCIHCGRDTSRQGKSLGVCVSGGGAYIVHPADYDEFEHQGGDMGWFPVGSECIKQVPAEFRLANPYDDKIKGV